MSDPAPAPHAPDERSRERARLATLWGLTIALACVVLRCISTYDPFPYWSGDPFIMASPVVGLTPAWALALDAITIASSIVMLTCLARIQSRSHYNGMIFAVFLALPFILVVPTSTQGLDAAVAGGHWAASILLAIVVFACLRDRELRLPALLLVSASLLGVLAMVIPKGVAQVYVEHPHMLRTFRANQDAFLASQSWSPGSAMARGYIRRLEQAEASGWFGLANVFATLAAAGVGIFATWLMQLLRVQSNPRSSARTNLLVVACAGLAMSAAGVYLAGSKGGFVAALLGLFLCAAAWLARRRTALSVRLHRIAGWLGPALIALTLLSVVARGLMGERINELSILFRWFYMQGAARIFASNLGGVGPVGFKDAYMVHKPAISPEDTAYAHSLLIDWIVGCGIIGIFLAIGWLLAVRSASRAVMLPIEIYSARESETSPSPATDALRTARALAGFCLIVPTGIAAFLEREAATPEGGLVRAAGIIGGLAVVWALHRCIDAESRTARENEVGAMLAPALGVGALVAAVHCQIELSGTTPGSCAWCLLLLAAAAGLSKPSIAKAYAAAHQLHAPATRVLERLSRFAFVLLVGVATFSLIAKSVKAASWQQSLGRAYARASMLREIDAARAALPSLDPSKRAQASADLAAQVAVAANLRTPPTLDALPAAIDTLRASTITQVSTILRTAADRFPDHFPTLRAASRVMLIDAQSKLARGTPPREAGVDEALTLLDSRRPAFEASASYWSWLGILHEQRASMPFDAPATVNTAPTALDRAAQAYINAAKFSPHDPLHPIKLSDLYTSLGDAENARTWAKRALDLDKNLRLDPLRQLTDAERSRLGSR
jgi:tetratricopeptide (TPR) repeat protein